MEFRNSGPELPRSPWYKSKSLVMLNRITRLLPITEMKPTLGLDNAWREKNEQLLF